MREITSHRTNECNSAIDVTADERDENNGNASHRYHCVTEDYEVNVAIEFQHGPIKEVGVNGLTHEVLLAILIDRLEGFQEGKYASDDNAEALQHLRDAFACLERRTQRRLARGVEGTHEV